MDQGFSEDEIREQLEKLGYYNVPHYRLVEFKKDLDLLVRQEQSGSDAQTNSDVSQDHLYDDGATRYQRTAFHDTNNYPLITQSPSKRVDPSSQYGKENEGYSIQVFGRDPCTRNLHQSPKGSTSAPSSPTKSTASSEGERRLIKRKVLRKINGESVLEESLLESEDDVPAVRERLRRLPLFKDDESDTSSVQDEKYYRRPFSAQPAVSRHPADNANLKSVIHPMNDHPHTRNLRRCDPVNRYHQFRESWDQHKAPGEKSHRNLRWSVREHMLYKNEIAKKPQRVFVPNNYVVPTDKKRKSLRWQIRADMAQGTMPQSGYHSN